jgi:hypothetical protein
MIQGQSGTPRYEVRTDEDGRQRRYYRMDGGEWLSVKLCVEDDRNINKLCESALRARLDKGETDPDRLFWEPLAWRNRAA